MAATKYMTVEQTEELIKCGFKDFGENRTDMFLEKYEALKDYKDIKWHFFGVVQSRKIRDIVNKISCLHSLDRISLAIDVVPLPPKGSKIFPLKFVIWIKCFISSKGFCVG